jgi:hypothetical protein
VGSASALRARTIALSSSDSEVEAPRARTDQDIGTRLPIVNDGEAANARPDGYRPAYPDAFRSNSRNRHVATSYWMRQ